MDQGQSHESAADGRPPTADHRASAEPSRGWRGGYASDLLGRVAAGHQCAASAGGSAKRSGGQSDQLRRGSAEEAAGGEESWAEARGLHSMPRHGEACPPPRDRSTCRRDGQALGMTTQASVGHWARPGAGETKDTRRPRRCRTAAPRRESGQDPTSPRAHETRPAALSGPGEVAGCLTPLIRYQAQVRRDASQAPSGRVCPIRGQGTSTA